MGDGAPPVNRIMLDLSRSHAHSEFWVEEFRFNLKSKSTIKNFNNNHD